MVGSGRSARSVGFGGRSWWRSAAVAVPLVAAGLVGVVAPAGAVTAGSSVGPGLAAQSASLTCLGEGTDPAAKLHHRTEILIKAPLRTVWNVQTRVAGWPTWQKSVTSMKRLDPGPLRPGSRFRWTTPAPATPSTPATTLVVTSTVHQAVPGKCIRWSGPAIGEGLRIDEGTHIWNFTKVPGGTLVRTEESWTGAQIEADPKTAAENLYPGLDFWLADLKTAAEARTCP
ncbi:SRPBCC family protein [Amycolatopsis ultiminotia]|uniref:SRPBCC family protein n=1 Tax=Amycolatopsis ultiminotia TaxID=543629 RepID=UPI0031E6C40A